MKRIVLAAAFVLAALPPAGAAVVASGPGGFTVKFEADVAATPAQAFETFTKIGNWWSSDHTFSGDAKNMSMDVSPGGAWRETLPNNGFVEHMRVIHSAPGAMLVLSGGLGPLQFMGVAGTMTVTFTAKDAGTHVTLEFSGGGYDPDNFAKWPAAVDGVIGEQFARYSTYANQ